MPKITQEQALELANGFREASNKLGKYRIENWHDLTPAERRSLEDEEWTLLNYSSDFITKAVGISLSDATISVEKLQGAVDGAARVVKKIKTAKKAIELAGALVALGAAIALKDPGAIATGAAGVYGKIKEINQLNKQEE